MPTQRLIRVLIEAQLAKMNAKAKTPRKAFAFDRALGKAGGVSAAPVRAFGLTRTSP